MIEAPRVDIALAVYNGERWLPAFLESLRLQTHRDWRLVVADDGSTDNSLTVLRHALRDDRRRLLMVERERVGTGAARTFSDALELCDAPFVALADQDDVWLPRKLEALLATLQGAHSLDTPSLAYSDMEVVDAQLNTISPSWWRYSRTPSSWSLCLRHTICQNTVPGCSMMVDQSLLRRALPVPPEAAMHDWWLMLVAVACGKVTCSSEVLVRYRRHPEAATYSYGNGLVGSVQRLLFGRELLRKEHAQSIVQAQALAQRCSLQLGSANARTVQRYIRCDLQGWWGKRCRLLRGRFRKSTLRGCVRFYACV
jgi:glycosyltransferase involved in cell wall biosynthesis